MNRILLTGTALLTLINAGMPASAAPKHATRYQRAPLQRQLLGSGAYVEGVDASSPAERAGLRPGDYIVGINGSPINNHSDVDPLVAGGGGRPLTLDVRRGGTIVRLRATPGYGLAPTPYGGVERRRMLGYSYTYYPFCPGGNYCGSSDDTPLPVYNPPPIIPDPPPPPLPPITN
jgi:membrane-associated protease RseP (regulator of RpoE activity)